MPNGGGQTLGYGGQSAARTQQGGPMQKYPGYEDTRGPQPLYVQRPAGLYRNIIRFSYKKCIRKSIK